MDSASEHDPAAPPASEKKEYRLYTLSEVAGILRVDRATVRRWAKEGVLKVVVLPQTGGRTVLRVSEPVLQVLMTDQYLPVETVKDL
ncbi:helix-turn-helix domain-containing protein [Dictyobacter formicarum]|uniref:Helix-turn-helix domain-containing protein n=1 Tax=Dictyobacter formicarum TaxID=2778368 RepID=A0ABQ3VQK6_9CHLR|nr:helix-turn-helix domain-containing protein [Dictyobacter formicarum]GHO88147.1 hypothetical protein KSZ_61530 [Dictyobacter formicarum]